jgi:hypothetical protein
VIASLKEKQATKFKINKPRKKGKVRQGKRKFLSPSPFDLFPSSHQLQERLFTVTLRFRQSLMGETPKTALAHLSPVTCPLSPN